MAGDGQVVGSGHIAAPNSGGKLPCYHLLLARSHAPAPALCRPAPRDGRHRPARRRDLPAYDIISEEERLEFLDRSPFNVVRVELPDGRYADAARLFDAWKDSGALARETTPALYGYRMSYQAATARRGTRFGVMGALVLEPPGHGILPHEQTTPKAKGDRLELIRATRQHVADLVPVHGGGPGRRPGTGLRRRARNDGPEAAQLRPV